MNNSHPLAEYYAEIIVTYLELSPKGRKQCAACGEIRDALKILDSIIFRRKLIYGEVLPFLSRKRAGTGAP